MMRRILVDRARAHRRAKRSGRWARVTLYEAVVATRPTDWQAARAWLLKTLSTRADDA